MRIVGRLFRFRRPLRQLGVGGIVTTPDAVAAAANPSAPNQLWVVDLAIVHTDEGWLHVAVVLDCYTRRCLGWWSADESGSDAVVRAVQMAAAQRSPSIPPGVHPRESADVALAIHDRCRLAGIAAAPGAAPSTMDAAVVEAFFALLRGDLIGAHSWPTRADAFDAICTWIEEYYNPGTIGTSTISEISEELDELSL